MPVTNIEAIRQIYESLPNVISVPLKLRRRRVEVIILPLDENGDDGNKLSDDERSLAFENLLKYAGAVRGGNPNGGDNDQIDADLANEHGKDL